MMPGVERKVRYTARNPALRWPLLAIDALLRSIRPPRTATMPANPQRILLCIQAHLGDAILATAVLAPLRRAFPQARFGVLLHPIAVDIVRDHPAVEWIDTVEHGLLDRSGRPLLQRLWNHWRSSRAAVRSIRSRRYDVAIDLYHYFPNSIPLLARCGIPVRIGWNHGGFAPLLTIALDEPDLALNVLERHRRLLAAIGVDVAGQRLVPEIVVTERARAGWQAIADRESIVNPFVALHVGAHAARRRWPTGKWAELGSRLAGNGRSLVLLGSGDADARTCRAIADACPAAVDLCNRLDWPQFVAAVSDCALLVAHDSAAIHLAAAFGRPRVCIAAGINDLTLWLQRRPDSAVVIRPTPCAPCHRSRGCASMECIRGVTSAEVAEAVERVGREAGSASGAESPRQDRAPGQG